MLREYDVVDIDQFSCSISISCNVMVLSLYKLDWSIEVVSSLPLLLLLLYLLSVGPFLSLAVVARFGDSDRRRNRQTKSSPNPNTRADASPRHPKAV
jgi:hypothetical protein